MGIVTRMPTEDARRLLGECFLFRELETEARNALFGRLHIRAYAAGETVFLMGSAGDSMMAVLSGSVRISVPSPEGKEIVLAILHAGEVFGEIAVLDGKGRTADARALTECSLAVLDRREVLSFFERHPQAWLRLVEVLCERLRVTDQHIAEVALLELPARLAKAMLRVSAAEPDAKGRAAPQVALSQRELGNIVGASRESVNKCLSDWQRRGIVKIEENFIRISNPAALEKLAEPDFS